MTDKQVIINNIDVTGCDHFSVYSGNGCRCYFLENEDDIVGCENYPNCYYKQLKRTESELACKEQECEELKERLYVQAKEKVKYIFELDQLKATNEDLLNIQYKLADNNKRLRQALTEIKEIVLLTLDCGEWIGQGDNKMEVILQKINECEVGNDMENN